MSSKHLTTSLKTSAKSNKPRSISIPNAEFGAKERLNERGKSENLLNLRVSEIQKIPKSQSPSPLLKQDVNDLLGVIHENSDPNMILQDLSFTSLSNALNQPCKSQKNEETLKTIEKQLASLRNELNIKNSLIEKLMKENNDLKNELGVYMASVEDNKENVDIQNKQINEKVKHLEEENKNLKNENKLCQEQLLQKTSLINELAEKLEEYHQNNKKSLEFFMSSFKSQMTEYMKDSQKQYSQINSSIQVSLRKARKDNKAHTAQKEKVLKNQASEAKFTSSCSKAENRATLAQSIGKNRKSSMAIGYVVSSDQSDEEKSNALLKNKTDKNPTKIQRHSYTPKRN